MKLKWIILFLFLAVSVNAQDFNSYNNMKIKTEISSSLLLERQSSSSSIQYVYSDLAFLPDENEFQEVNYSTVSEPKAEEKLGKDSVYFRWDKPQGNELKFKIYSEEDVTRNFRHIQNKIKFPLVENLDDLRTYLTDTETVTSKDPKIIEKANELAQGEDDLFLLVSKIGSWTKNNINYSLETLTADVSQNASWVLENKIGVCDELTSLFVAMLRSLNIPARFVTGQSYTNVINGFGNHAWAEVYFPGYGWIPFDPTYGQLGYSDATHIKMKVSQDIKDSDISYGWLSKEVDVTSSGIKISSEILDTGDIYKENIELNLEILKDDIGPNSYIPIKVNVKNLNNYYLPVSVYVSKASTKLNDNTREILLKPYEEKSAFFIIKTPESLDPGFVYTSDIEIVDNFNNSVSKKLHFSSDGEAYSLEQTQLIINQFNKEEGSYSKNLDLVCNLDKRYYYDYESGKITCNIFNKGNNNLQDLEVCYNKQCKMINLDSLNHQTVEFDFTGKDKEFFVTANSNDVNKVFILNPGISKVPKLNLTLLAYPSETYYFNDEVLKINLEVDSQIKDVSVLLNNKRFYSLKSFINKADYEIDLKGFNLKEVNKISVNYKDKNGNSYKTEKTFIVDVKKPFYVKYYWLIILIIILIFSMILRRKQRLGSRRRN